jgi:hypothetical protein
VSGLLDRFLVLIPASGRDDDLVELAMASVRRAEPTAEIQVMAGRGSHGFKLNFGRDLIGAHGYVVTLDSDCVVFPGWGPWIRRVLSDPHVIACGAGRGDRPIALHPSMTAMRASTYKRTPSWEATPEADTGVRVSEWLEAEGWLYRATSYRQTDDDWVRYAAVAQSGELWWHLGSGTHSAWPGLVKQAYRVVRALGGSVPHRESLGRVARRRRFVRTARLLYG